MAKTGFGTAFGGSKPMFGNPAPAAAAKTTPNTNKALECIPPLYDGGKCMTTDDYNAYVLKLTEFIDGSAVDFKKDGKDKTFNCKQMLEKTYELEKENVQMIRKIQEKLNRCIKPNTTKSEESVKTLTELLQRLRRTRPDDDISQLKMGVEYAEYDMANQRIRAEQTRDVEE